MSAIVFVSDPATAIEFKTACSALGQSVVMAPDPAAVGVACDAGAVDLLGFDGPLVGPQGVETLRALRRAGVVAPAVFACRSETETRALGQDDGLRPFYTTVAVSSVLGVDTWRGPRRATLAPEPHGKLGEHGLADIMVHALATEWSGKLVLKLDASEKTIFFEDGQAVYCASKIFTENFGQMLLRRGVITEVEYEWARKIQQRENIRQGEALVKIGTLTHQALFEQLRAQIDEKIINCFSWCGATYELTDDNGFLNNINKFVYNSIDLVARGYLRFRPSEHPTPPWAIGCCASVQVATEAAKYLGERALLAASTFQPEMLGEVHGQATVVWALEHFGFLATASQASALPLGQGVDATLVRTVAESCEPAAADVRDLAKRLARTWLRVTSDNHFSALGLTEADSEKTIEAARDTLLAQYDAEAYRELLKGRTQRAVRAQRQLREIRAKFKTAAATLLDPATRAHYIEQRTDSATSQEASLRAEDEFLVGKTKLEAGEVEDARGNFERACQYNPTEHVYTLYDGWASYKMGETGRGKQLILKAITANPMLFEGYLFWARVLADEGDYDEALGQARTALTFSPESAEAQALMNTLEKRRYAASPNHHVSSV